MKASRLLSVSIVVSLCLLMLAGCGGSGGGSHAVSSLAAGEVAFEGLVLENNDLAKQRLGKNSDTGFFNEDLSGDPATDVIVVLLRNGVTKLDSSIVNNGEFSLSYDPDDLADEDVLTINITDLQSQLLETLTLMPIDLAKGAKVVLNLELRRDPDNAGLNGLVAFIDLGNDLDITASNAIDTDGDGDADTEGARISYPDNLIQFDKDMDGIFGEPGDLLIPGVDPSLFDADISNGYQHDNNDRDLNGGTAQDTVGNIIVRYDPRNIVGDEDEEFFGTLKLIVTKAGPESIFGARIYLSTTTGDIDDLANDANGDYIEIDPNDTRVQMRGNGSVYIYLYHSFAANTVGSVATTVTANNGDTDDTGRLTIDEPTGVRNPAPTVTGVTPASGPSIGGSTVTVTGSDFKDNAVVFFDGVPAQDVDVVSSGSISCVTPPGPVGLVSVTVVNPDAQSDTKENAFEYLGPPEITGINPDDGPTTGGAATTVTGESFLDGADIYFGRGKATNTTVVSENTITCVTPAGSAGSVTVTIINGDGQSDILADGYTYVAIPAGVTITESGGSTDVIEGGATDTYTIVLDNRPSANVVITIAADIQGSIDTSPVTFTSDTWETPQTVTVSAVDDDLHEDVHASTITHTAISGDTDYSGIAIDNVAANVTDNDTAGVTITESGGSSDVTEGGATDTYTVVLTTEPTAEVTITVTPDAQSTVDNGLGGNTLVFDADNWSDHQTITVTAVNDTLIEGNHTSTIGQASVSMDDNYDAIGISNVTANLTDNELPADVAFQNANSASADESAANHAVTIELTTVGGATLAAELTVDSDSSDGSATAGDDYTAVATTVTFPAGAGNGATQTVNIPVLHDTDVEGDETIILTLSNASANGVLGAQTTHSATITDDDFVISGTVTGDIQVGVTINLTGDATDNTVTAGDGTYSFMVANGNYTLTPSLANCIFTPATLSPAVNDANVPNQDFISTFVLFNSAVDYATGDPYGITNGDFNGDDNPDLAVVNNSDDDISVFLGNGDGTFAGKVDYPVGSGPFEITNGDFDNDGNLDLAVANIGGDNVSVLLGNGDGSFGAAANYTAGGGPYKIICDDFNNNGALDLVVANNSSDNVSVLLGNGNGTFAAKVDYATGNAPAGMTSGDFNHDGARDIAVANGSASTLSVLLGNGNGTFAGKVDYGTGSSSDSITNEDFNHDGNLDLAVTNSSNDNLSILLGNGNGTFAAKADYATGDAPKGITIGDFDKNGNVDLAVVNENDNDVSILLGNGNGTFADKVNYAVGDAPFRITSGDFDNDGQFDLAVTNWGDADISILLNTTVPGADTFTAKVDYVLGNFPYRIAVGDYNKDGDLDLALTNWFGNNVSILLGNGNGTFAAKVDYAVGTTPYEIINGDFDNDGNLDLAVTNYGDDNVSILLGIGDGTFAAKVDYAVVDGPYGLTIGDFDHDGVLDLAVANFLADFISILLGNGNGTFAAKVDYASGNLPIGITCGDFNNDGDLDLAAANYGANDNMSIFLGVGNGTFAAKVDYAVGNNPYGITNGDFDNDGDLDVAVANYDDGDISIYQGNGTGTMSGRVDYAAGGTTYDVISGDFDNDGNLDLAATNTLSNSISILSGNGNSTFAAKVDYSVGGNPRGINIGDFDNDGDLDLAVANSNGNVVAIFLGE
ncbi:beta strand repeat-containing protein [Planctomycetota bacterium]